MVVIQVTPAAIESAVRRLRDGGLVAFPTETFYGLGCDPRRSDAVLALFACKGRVGDRALPLVAANREQVTLVAPDWRSFPAAMRLADLFWPGPLSLVLPGWPGLADHVRAGDGSVAVRWTANAIAADLARGLGFPIVATSANRSGAAPLRHARDVPDSLGGNPGVLVLDGGATPGGLPSTLVDVRVPAVTVVRAGAIEERAIRAALGGEAVGGPGSPAAPVRPR